MVATYPVNKIRKIENTVKKKTKKQGVWCHVMNKTVNSLITRRKDYRQLKPILLDGIIIFTHTNKDTYNYVHRTQSVSVSHV